MGKPPPYTEWHGNHYRAKLRIPEQLRFHFPINKSGTRFKKFLFENLHTDDDVEAATAAQAFVHRMQRLFGRIARRDRIPAGLLSEAQRWQNALRDDTRPSNSEDASAEPITAEELQSLGLEQHYSEFDALVDRAYDLQDKIGHARTMRFFNLASGRTTSIYAEMEDWLRFQTYSPATHARYRKTVEDLIAWCRSNRIPGTIEAINVKRAGRFLSRRGNRDRKAIANERAALSSLWNWSNAQLMSDLRAQVEPQEGWTGDRGENPWRNFGAHVSSDTDK